MATENITQPLAEFYLSGLWAWRPGARNQIIQAVKGLDLEKVYFDWDNDFGWLRVRCATADKEEILKRYLEIQSEVESQVKHQDDMEMGGSSRHDVQDLPTVSPDPSILDATIEFEVPAELRHFPEVSVWQDLQPYHRRFSMDFLMDGARNAIEKAHGAKLCVDEPARVIFVGASSKAAAEVVKRKLTTLLRGSLWLRAPTRHVLFVEKEASAPGWTVDVRDMKQINPVLAPSSLLDPLDHLLPEKYRTIYHDTYCLRLCYKDPFKDVTWSTFGPRAQDVFGGKAPQRNAHIFESVEVTPKERCGGMQADTPVTTIKQWIEELPKPSSGTLMSDLEHSLRKTNIDSLGENDPVPLRRAPDVNQGEFEVEAEFEVTPAHAAPNCSLLDEPIVQDTASALPRALKPHRRSIIVPHPDSVSKRQDPRPQLPAARGSEFDQCIKRFLQLLLRPMKSKYGVVRLRAEIGRFFMHNIERSGVARNNEKQPANGWKPEHLVACLKGSKDNTSFTKILSYWGNDVDYLANMKERKQKIWNPTGQCRTFFDFHFHAQPFMGAPAHFVLEVNGGDFSWNLREARSPYDPIIVHCLSQHWDFRMVATHDYTLDQNMHFGAFARALVDSLVVRPPILEFQYDFDGPPPVTIDEVRIRQVNRLQTLNKKTFLDITRVFPTEVKDFPGTKHRAVRSIPGDDRRRGVFKGWYEASVSSARMEELLQQNETLVPGDEVDWTLEQLEQEGVFEDLYQPACQIVKRMDGVGVKCDNGIREAPKPFDYQY